MKETALIYHSNQSKAEQLQAIISTVQDTVILSPRSAQITEEYGTITLIVIPAYEPALLESIRSFGIADHVPVLIVGDSEIPPSSLMEKADERLIDYLHISATKEQIKMRILFLNRVAKLTREHDNCLKTHTTFLNTLTNRDSLTGLYNRYHFNKTLAEKVDHAKLNGEELTILFLDIDCFSEINKSCGQSFGDFTLNSLGSRLTKSTGPDNFCFRLSGGEFAVIMPGTTLQDGQQAATEILTACTAAPFQRGEIKRNITLSIGIASYTIHNPEDYDEFVNMAQTALYQAKAEGRDRIYIYSPKEYDLSFTDEADFVSVKETIERLLEKNRSSTISSLQLLARDIAGPTHQEHIEKVKQYTELLCKKLNLPPPIIQTLQNSAILYSSIRYLIHNDLLGKRETFTEAEQEILHDFPYKLSEMVEIFDYFAKERLLLMARSEKFDGSGYPEGLKGDEIPIGARIINVIDSFSAMTASRPYRQTLSPETILQELQYEAGKQFDPSLVIQMLNVIEENKLLDIDSNIIKHIREHLAQELT